MASGYAETEGRAPSDEKKFLNDSSPSPPDGESSLKQKDDAGDIDYEIDYDKTTEKKLMRRIDLRLLPILGALYSIALIDRNNISVARVSGMDEDLVLFKMNRYTIALVVFFPPYALFELPSNILLRQVGAAKWLSFIAFSWGCVMLGQGFVPNFGTLSVCRFLLGLFEAGFFPGCTYLITCWYHRYETQQRLAWFYLVSALAGGFSYVLAYGIVQMEGLGGIRGWRWIFIIEGLLTVVVAVVAYFIIVDFPDKAEQKGFLSRMDATFIKQRLDRDRGDATADPLTLQKTLVHIADFKLWIFSLMFMSTTMPAYALAYFAPVIIAGMGYDGGVASALSAPPVVFAVAIALVVSFLSDRYKLRWPGLVFNACIGIVGLMMTKYSTNDMVRYGGLFLGQAGCQGNIPAVLAYQSNNIRTQSKRSVGSALQIGFGAIGGILGSTVFMEAEKDIGYPTGLWVTTGLQMFVLGAVAVLSAYFVFMNRKQKAGTLSKPIEGLVGFQFTL